jgi:hypothetical protein
MSNSDLIRKYFSAYENKDRKAIESLLSNDFVFTRTIIALTANPISNAAGPIASSPQRMRLRRRLKRTTKPSFSTTAKPRLAADPGTRNSSLSKETRSEKSRSTSVLPQNNRRKQRLRIVVRHPTHFR